VIPRWSACLLLAAALEAPDAIGQTPRFGRDILPILSEHCLGCHGPDEEHRKAGLRLDLRESATGGRDHGPAIIPGEPAQSQLLTRILSNDPGDKMPPPEVRKPGPTPAEVALLREWIQAGAPWGRHWAFEKPERPPLPTVGGNPVDAFVRARLAEEGLDPAPRAERHILARRLAFDLTGLPPDPAAAAEFLADPEPGAVGRYVDQLLASPHHGERMAMWWLDAARYADTDGFQADATRENWPWRDWVVDAFNQNMPFDQFTLEQFAGDLLPNATPAQKLATCFHRNHMANGEGGRDPEESRVDYVIDRVNTTGTVWLGLTLGCAQCHSHKFDPISHADYYRMSAFFDSISEDGQAGKGAKPFLAYESPRAAAAIAEEEALFQERKEAEELARREAGPAFEAWLASEGKRLDATWKAWLPQAATALHAAEGTLLKQDLDMVIQASGPNPRQEDYQIAMRPTLRRVTGLRLEVLPDPAHTGGLFARGASGHFTLTDIKVQVRRAGEAQIRDIQVAAALADHSDDPKKHEGYGDIRHVLDDDPRNGWSLRDAGEPRPHIAQFALAEPLALEEGEELVFEMRHRSTLGDANIGRFRLFATGQRGPALNSLDTAPMERWARRQDAPLEPELRESLLLTFLEDHPPHRQALEAREKAGRQLAEAKAAAKADVMVLEERAQPRETHILLRGVWDRKGERVGRGVPESIAPWPEGAPTTRLELARWIVSRDNPLAARVLANHLWQLCWGSGLVRTTEDFGLQGERPSHPELLDWLAVELMESGWNLRHILRLIVASDTYQQSSAISPAALERDPENRLLARGARFRLPSWMLRDAALRLSGLLNPRVGGPPIRPYQPEGVWEEIFMGRFRYEPTDGPGQYRRTLYAFWRRTIAPTFLFDSAQRRVCETRSPRTNTPLQALVLMNDEGFLEASVGLARAAFASHPTTRKRLEAITRRVLLREFNLEENAALLESHNLALDHYAANPGDARRFIQRGQAGAASAENAAELAALTLAASLILNLDEAITHE